MANVEKYKIIERFTIGELKVSENSQFNHLDADVVIVEAGIRAKLHGHVRQLLVLKKDCKVFLHGQLHGKVQDDGGRLYLFEE